jgi:hypothetical protein
MIFQNITNTRGSRTGGWTSGASTGVSGRIPHAPVRDSLISVSVLLEPDEISNINGFQRWHEMCLT